MERVLIIEDDPNYLKKIIDILLPQQYGESFEPRYLLTICTDELLAKKINPRDFNYILIDHDLPNRGTGTSILRRWGFDVDEVGVHEKSGIDFIKDSVKKIIAISCVPINNELLLNAGCDVAIDKMNPFFEELLKTAIEGKLDSENKK